MIAILLGTRPEIVKMSPIVRECERRGLDYYILHTGQHYSYEMDRAFGVVSMSRDVPNSNGQRGPRFH